VIRSQRTPRRSDGRVPGCRRRRSVASSRRGRRGPVPQPLGGQPPHRRGSTWLTLRRSVEAGQPACAQEIFRRPSVLFDGRGDRHVRSSGGAEENACRHVWTSRASNDSLPMSSTSSATSSSPPGAPARTSSTSRWAIRRANAAPRRPEARRGGAEAAEPPLLGVARHLQAPPRHLRLVRRRYGVELDADAEAIVTIGSKEGIGHLALALLGPGDVVFCPSPTYPIHQYSVIIAGGDLRSIR